MFNRKCTEGYINIRPNHFKSALGGATYVYASYWIEQLLTDMRQRVVVDGEVSSWKSVLSGQPQ